MILEGCCELARRVGPSSASRDLLAPCCSQVGCKGQGDVYDSFCLGRVRWWVVGWVGGWVGWELQQKFVG